MSLDAILFGGIGAVAECAELDRKAWNGAMRAQGLAWDWGWSTYRALMATRDARSPVLRHAIRLGETVDVAAVERSQARLFAALLAEGLPLRPGVASVVRAAAGRQLKLGLVTRSGPDPVRAMLKATARARGGVGFDVAILRDDLPTCRRTRRPTCWRWTTLGSVPRPRWRWWTAPPRCRRRGPRISRRWVFRAPWRAAAGRACRGAAARSRCWTWPRSTRPGERCLRAPAD